MIHGGGWVQGDKERMVERFCVPLVHHDFVVANVEYRLAKAATAPAAVNDVLKAAQWFHDHAPDYKVNPNQILVAGGSSGGHLALMGAMVPDSAGFGSAGTISGGIGVYGITDCGDRLD